MFKKYRSLILGLVVVMALAVPGILAASSEYALSSGMGAYSSASSAYSSAVGDKEKEIQMAATLADPPIDLTINGTGAIILNPYQLNITASSAQAFAAALSGETATNSSVIGLPIVIENNSPSKVSASAKCYVTLGSSKAFSLVNTKIDAKETAKKVLLYLEAHKANADGSIVSSESWSPDGGYNEKYHVLFAKDNKGNFKEIATMEAATTTNGELATPSYTVFKVRGQCTKAPTTPWNSTDDAITAAYVVFKFHNVA